MRNAGGPPVSLKESKALAPADPKAAGSRLLRGNNGPRRLCFHTFPRAAFSAYIIESSFIALAFFFCLALKGLSVLAAGYTEYIQTVPAADGRSQRTVARLTGLIARLDAVLTMGSIQTDETDSVFSLSLRLIICGRPASSTGPGARTPRGLKPGLP